MNEQRRVLSERRADVVRALDDVLQFWHQTDDDNDRPLSGADLLVGRTERFATARLEVALTYRWPPHVSVRGPFYAPIRCETSKFAL